MTSMQDPTAPTKKPRRFSFSQIASGFAVILSLFSLFVSVMELSSIQEQQRANVWPYLQLTGSYTQEGFKVELQNKGVGPAIVNELKLHYANKTYSNLDNMIVATLGPEDAFSYEVYKASNPTKSVVASGEVINLFSVPWEPRTRRLIENWEQGANMVICYCSIHEECWRAELSKRENQSVEACE